MIVQVGLTGGMGSGKSRVRQMLAESGIETLDADSLAKEIASSDPVAIAAIADRFGAGLYSSEGVLDRPALARIVFADEAALADLNKILHPRVFAHVEARLTDLAASGSELLVIEAALFYESGWDVRMDAMTVVTAPLARRLRWLSERDGSTEAQIRARLRFQLPQSEKAARADYVLANDGTLDDLRNKIPPYLEWLQGLVHQRRRR